VPALTVVLAVETAGLLIASVAVLVVQPPWFDDTGQVLAAAGAGLSGVVGLVCFYRALAIGTMSVVAPVSSTGLVVPVAVGIASGHSPGPVQAVGIVFAAAGVVLASQEAADEERAAGLTAGLGLALIAALGFGGYFVGSDVAAEGGVLVTVLVARTAAVPAVAVVAALQGVPLVPGDRGTALRLFGVGALDLAATGLYALATTKGLLAVVGVLGALYPVMTVLLARTVLGERLQRHQAMGVTVALAGVALIAAG
jgi:drug/metabolite transporter (DMT)-like permease